MKTLTCLAILALAAALTLQGAASAHGGTYRGPGGADTAPSGSSSGGSSSSGSTSGGGTSSSSGKGRAASGSSGSSSSGGGSSLPSLPSGPLRAEWEPWWAFNRDPYLNLKAVIHHGDLLLGSDDYFLGYSPLELVRDRLRPSDQVVQEQIAPALQRVLATASDNDLVSGAQVALAKIGDRAGEDGLDASLGLLTELLASPNQEISETAAVSLGILADARALEVLRELLYDTERGRELVASHEVHWRTRAFAAYGLGLVGYRSTDPVVRRRVVRELTAALESRVSHLATPDVAVACLTALGLVPLEEDPNCMVLPDERLEVTHCRRGQLRWLLEFGSRENLQFIVAAHVPTTLARLVAGTSEGLGLRHEVMGRLLAQARALDLQRELRASAIQSLGAITNSSAAPRDREARATLARIARESREPQTRTLALVAFGQASGRRAGVAARDLEGLRSGREFLTERFQQGRSSDRPWAALALALMERRALDSGISDENESAAILRAAFAKSGSPSDVGALAIALGVMRDVESADLLIEKLDRTSEDRARGYICIGLGLMNAREAVAPLRDILAASRYRPLLLREAAISLGLLGDKEVVADLVAQLQAATSLTAQSSIAAALGTIGDARSIRPLLDMLEDEDLNVRARAFAAVALGIVADKEPLPWNAKIAVGVNYLANPPTLTDGQGLGILDIL